MRYGAIVGMVLMLSPIVVLAQSGELEAKIRASLLTDPRTANLTAAEIDALVAALAERASADGSADQYLANDSAPQNYSSDSLVEAPAEENSTLPFIISAVLLCAILGMVVVNFMGRKDVSGIDESHV